MERLELVVFVGLQGAGKSTFYRARFSSTHACVSMDFFPRAKNKAARQARLVREALLEGRSVVVDNTNPTPASRALLVALALDAGARALCYFFESSVAESLARNAAREGRARVPDVAIFATAARLVVPSLAEGFDEIVRVRPLAGGIFDLRPETA